MELYKEIEKNLILKGYKNLECKKEQKESKSYHDMMNAIKEYKKEIESNERK